MRGKMSDTFHFLYEINQGYVNNCSEKYFHGRQNNLVSWIFKVICCKGKKKIYHFRGNVWGHSFYPWWTPAYQGNVIIKNSFHSSWSALIHNYTVFQKSSLSEHFENMMASLFVIFPKLELQRSCKKLSQSSRKTWIKHAYPEF